MYNFILQTIIMLSLGTIIYLIARTIPRVTETTSVEPHKNYFEQLVRKIPLEKADALINAMLGKFLRKFKIIVMKLDNFLTGRLRNLKSGNGGDEKSGQQPSIFEKKE